jgi:hypothetical protein
MKWRILLVLFVAAAFLFSVSCKEKEGAEGPEKAEVKAKTESVEKGEKAEISEKAEKAEIGEKEEKEEEEEEENEKAEAGEKEEATRPALDLKVLPEAVLSAFKAAYPNAVIKAASKEVENGVTQYEIESLDGTLARDLLYAPDGKVIEVEEAIAAKDLPAVVVATLAKEYPGYEFVKAETLTKGAVKQFEISIKVKDKTLGVTIDPTGKIVEKEPEK